jgi:multidrug efflux pump subunit AcrA (membrane-fusion protein)
LIDPLASKKGFKFMKLRLFALALILVGLGSVAFVLVGPNFGGSSASKYLTTQVSTGIVAATSVATGNVAASTVYGLRFGATADIVTSTATTSGSGGSTGGTNSSSATSLVWPVKTVGVKVGQRVTQGTLLASADATEAQLALTSAQATLTSAQSKLTTDQGGPDAVTLAQDKNQLTQAQTSYNQAVASRTNTNQQNALSLSQAQSAVSSAQAQLAADQAITPPVPQATLDKDNADIASAQQNLASTQLKVKQSNQQADQQVTNADLASQAAQLTYQAKTAPTPAATIATDQAQVASDQATVDADQLAVTNATLTAPADGLIIAVNILVGVNAPTGYAIEESIGPMVATASFAEADISKLQVGQSATVLVNGPAVSVAGTLSQIVPATTSAGSSSVVTYAVTVTLTSPPDTVLAGMSATVTVTTASVDNVLRIPTSAVNGSATSGYTVQVMNADDSLTAATVQIGLVTTSWTQITSGLAAEQTIVTGTVSTRTTTTTAGGGGLNTTTLPVGGGGFGR